MSEQHKFEPDYTAWWKKNLTNEQLCWLLLGINPDHKERYDKLNQNIQTEADQKWFWAFYNYCDEKYYPQRLQEYKNSYTKLLANQNKKEAFQIIYNQDLPIPTAARDFALQMGYLKINSEFEKYKQPDGQPPI